MSNTPATRDWVSSFLTKTLLNYTKSHKVGNASTSKSGTIKVDGTTITVDSNGVAHAIQPTPYTLPKASEDTLGGVKVGDNLTIDSDGKLNATASAYTLPVATSSSLGGVKIGDGITISEDGTISASGGGGGTTVVANPEEDATDELEKIKIGGTVYSIPEGGSGGSLKKEYVNAWTNPNQYNPSEIDISEYLDNYDFLEFVYCTYEDHTYSLVNVVSTEYLLSVNNADPLAYCVNGFGTRHVNMSMTDKKLNIFGSDSYVIKEINAIRYTGSGSGGSSIHEYSTEEKVVGKWIDGKDIYEIVSDTKPEDVTIIQTISTETGDFSLLNFEKSSSVVYSYDDIPDGNIYIAPMFSNLVNDVAVLNINDLTISKGDSEYLEKIAELCDGYSPFTGSRDNNKYTKISNTKYSFYWYAGGNYTTVSITLDTVNKTLTMNSGYEGVYLSTSYYKNSRYKIYQYIK